MKSKLLYLGLLFLYLIPSYLFDFVFDFWQEGLVPYYFEFIYIAICIFIFKNQFKIKNQGKQTRHFLRYFIGGIVTILYCKIFATELPFDLGSRTIFFIIVFLAPILEELIFRFALWNAIEKITGCSKVAHTLTTILFSLAHFKAILIITPRYMTFVTFQALYTLILGHTLGMRYRKNRNVLEVIILHILFNLGFFLGHMGIY
jgi:membrane protease YdiL (CAAX protease family)